MIGLSENQLSEQLSEVGNLLFQPPNSTPELLNLLDEVEFLLTKVGQAPSQLMQRALLIPMKALIANELLRHSDPNVRVTMASCINEVIRITAPIPPYDDDKMREVFELIVSSFDNLSCQPGRCYSKAVLILESVAKLRSCVMMLDLDSDPLVTKMFELFLKNISPKHPQAVLLYMVDIMKIMIQESDYVSLELLKVLLASIRTEKQRVSPKSWELGAKILEGCADKLRPFIVGTVSSMGCCLEDYGAILLSICKPEHNIVTNVINDSSFPVNNGHYGNMSHPGEVVQALEATKSFKCVDALGTRRTPSQRVRKHNPHNLDEEATGPHDMDDQPSGNPDDYVQALVAAESCQIPPAEYVQALEASESHDCFIALETEKTPSNKGKKFDEEATGMHQVNGEPSGDRSHPPEYVQALAEAESFDCVIPLESGGTAPKRGNLDSQNLDKDATGLEREHNHHDTADNNNISKNDEISWKDVTFKKVDGEATVLKREQNQQGTADGNISENDGMLREDVPFKGVKVEAHDVENKRAYHSFVLGDNKKKRGRPRKEDVTNVSNGSGNKSNTRQPTEDKLQFSDPLQRQRRHFSLDDEAVETPHGRINYGDALVGCRIKVWWPDDRRYYEGTITLFDASVRKHKVRYVDGDAEILNLREERWQFLGDKTPIDNPCQTKHEPSGNLNHPTEYVEESFECVDALGIEGTAFKRARKQKSQNLDVEGTNLHETNDAPFGNLSQPPDYVHALEAAESCQIPAADYVQALEALESFDCIDALGTRGTPSNRGKKFDEEASGMHQSNDVTSGDLSHPPNNVQALEAAESFECVNALGNKETPSRRGKILDSQNLDEQEHQVTSDSNIGKDGVLMKGRAFKRVKEEAHGFENKEAYDSSVLGDNRRKRGRPRKKDVSSKEEFSGGSEEKVALAEHAQPLEASESIECVNALRTGGSASNREKKSDSQNLDEEAVDLEREQDDQDTTDDDISKNNEISGNDLAFKRVREEANGCENKQAYTSSAAGDNRRKRGRPRKKDDSSNQGFPGGSGNKAALVEYVQALEVDEHLQCVSGTVSRRRKISESQDKEATGIKHEQDHEDTTDDDVSKKDVKKEADDIKSMQGYDSSVLGTSRRKRGRPRKEDVSGESGNKAIRTPNVITNYEDDLVGCRIKVWWPLDRRYYKGKVTLFDASMRMHKVKYNDGDEEILNLRKEHWLFIGGETPTDIGQNS